MSSNPIFPHGRAPRRAPGPLLISLSLLSLLSLLFGGLAACGSAGESTSSDERSDTPPASTATQDVLGQCARDEATLRDPVPVSCALDTSCPCGSFCDPLEHRCTFECMVPPAGPQESCATGTQCDDTGRCVGPSTAPPPHAATLATLPALVKVAPAAGPASQVTVRLSLYTTSNDTAALTRGQATEVRVAAGEGLEVSCNAASYAASCQLTAWTFAWDGARHLANRSFWVRSLPGNTAEDGQVNLHIDELDAHLVVPTRSSAPEARAGLYQGLATSASVANGVPVTVRARGDLLLIRDPSQTLAPEGALLLDDLDAPTDVATARRVPWLRPLGAATSAGALIAEVAASGLAAFNPATGALSAGFTITLPGAGAEPWTLQLQRSGDSVAECATTADCAAGLTCVPALAACVPAEVWTPPADPLGNHFDDPRSASWWTAISGLLGSGDATPPVGSPARAAFATTGPDLIESLLCSVDETEASAGRLGVTQLRQGAGPSLSGDLACVKGLGGGTPTLSPGAVGLGTYRDRQGNIAVSSALLGTCLQDLARAPSSGWAANFGSAVGQCANLARFVPALRLLSTGELDKRTQPSSPRGRGLLVRLLQQWAQLHGFLASTGLSDREYDDATAASLTESRQELLSLLDMLDAGWAALLDQRVAPTVAAAATWAPTDTSSSNDYREARKPVVYWTFNDNVTPQRDLIRGVDLLPYAATNKPGCQIRIDRDAISGDWNCPGLLATLPTTAPSIAGNGDLTVTMFTNTPAAATEFQPYFGGTLFMTETLAAVSSPLDQRDVQPTLSLVHPTSDGGTEWVTFDWAAWPSGLTNTSFAVTRDTTRMTYTLYVWRAEASTWLTFTQRYYHAVGGKLPVSPRTIRLGGGQWPNYSAFPGLIDDFAIFDSALSKREVARFATARGTLQTHRDVWPADQVLTSSPTQELKVPVGASLLEAQIAHLEVVARLAAHLRHEAPAACGGNATARTNVDTAIARAGRTLRQSAAIEVLARADVSDRAAAARRQLRGQRSAITRTLFGLATCADPYGLEDHEVPLYFGDVVGETAAFFAASDHLLGLAEARAAAAVNTLNLLRARWDAARQSQLQQQLDDQTRAIRVDEQQTRFGEQLKRLCGIADQTTQQVLQQVKDGTFSVERCFVTPTPTCLAQHSTTAIMDADPSCYLGIIGAQLMDVRASYHAQQAAYQSWQAALGNAEGAERQCVLKEMDLYGCSALDRHQLAGVTCPSGHQGTLQLVAEFNRSLTEQGESQAWFGAIVSAATSVAAVVATVSTGGAGAAFLGAARSSLALLGPELERSAAQRRRNHEALLQQRALEDDLRACWTQADQFERAIAAAEEGSKEASARMQTSLIQYQNALAEAQELVLEAPVAIDREQTRPSIPIAFHYWLPDELATYRAQLESARRYAYMALRATEYDLQQTFTAPADQSAQPSRAAVLGAWRPDTLVQQLALLRSATDARRLSAGRPSRAHLVLDVAHDLFGLDAGSQDLGAQLQANARPVYSSHGEYLGEGVRFSFVPRDGASAPVWRCAERLWRANVGRAADLTGSLNVKLLKRTVFGSRSCADDSLQIASLRPERNLLMSGGEPVSYLEQPNHTVADVNVVDLNILGNLDAFQHADDFSNGASTELAGQGLFGDYILLFTAPSLSAGLQLESLHELYLRFDFLSVDNLPIVNLMRQGEVSLERSRHPIVVD